MRKDRLLGMRNFVQEKRGRKKLRIMLQQEVVKDGFSWQKITDYVYDNYLSAQDVEDFLKYYIQEKGLKA